MKERMKKPNKEIPKQQATDDPPLTDIEEGRMKILIDMIIDSYIEKMKGGEKK